MDKALNRATSQEPSAFHAIPRKGMADALDRVDRLRDRQCERVYLAWLTGFFAEGTPFAGTSTPEVQVIAFRTRVRQLSLSQVAW